MAAHSFTPGACARSCSHSFNTPPVFVPGCVRESVSKTRLCSGGLSVAKPGGHWRSHCFVSITFSWLPVFPFEYDQRFHRPVANAIRPRHNSRAVVEKILRGYRSGADERFASVPVGGLWEGPLRTLATAQSPPESGDLARESAEPSELQLVLNPKYL